MNADHDLVSPRAAQPLDAADRERIERAYALPSASVSAAAWDELISRAGSDDAPITVIEIDRLREGAKSRHVAYHAAIVFASCGAPFLAT